MPQRRDPSLIPLSHDHHHGLVRVFEIRQALRKGGDLPDQVRRTRDFHRDHLVPHFRAEEEALVPALRTAGADVEAALARLTDEHERLREMAAALDAGAERLAAFADLLESHIRFEERELFPLYQQRVDAAACRQVEAAIRRILNRPDDATRACALPGGGSES